MSDWKGDVGALIVRVRLLMPEWRSDELSEIEYLPGGYSNDNYHFRYRRERYVLRLPVGSQGESEWRLERAFYESPGAIVVPEVVAFDVDSGAMISRWVEGPLMVDAPPNHDRLIAFLQGLHENLAPASRTYDPIARSKKNLATPGPDQPSSRVRRLVSKLRWPQGGQSACHNDFNPWNVICATDGRWVTLDWESHGNNDPLFDLVTMHQGLNFDDSMLPRLCEELVRESVASSRIEQVLIGFWVREYAWAFAEWQRGNHREELREQMALAEEKLGAM